MLKEIKFTDQFSLVKKRWIKSLWGRIFICILVVLFILLLILGIYSYGTDSINSNEWRVSYNDNWMVEFQDEKYSGVNLSEFRFPHSIKAGESVTVTNQIPYDLLALGYEAFIIKLETHNSTIKVIIDGQEQYSYGQERYASNKMVGSGTHYINIKPNDEGKQISIVYTAIQQSAFSSFDDMCIYNGNKIVQYELVKGKIPFTVSIFLIMMGFCIMIITAVACVKDMKFLELFWVGGISAFVGTWSLCYYGFIQMFNVSIYVSSIVEYCALYFFAIPALLYFKGYMDNILNKKMTYIFRIIFALQITVDIVLCFLHLTGIMLFPSALPLMHVLMLVEMLYVLVILIMNSKKGDLSSKTVLFGAIVMVLAIVMEYLSYSLDKYAGIKISKMEGFAAIGTLIFIFTLITAFAIQIAEHTKIATEKAVLYRMAYTDELTKLYNRRYCEQKLNSLTRDQLEYGIFNFDLNGLKGINDTQGHNIGDSLIAGFAEILQRTFGGVGTVGRMGGDEFIVIVEGLAGFDHEAYIQKLDEYIAKENEKERRFGYSASYGYADSHEFPEKKDESETEMVYKMADSRMYEYKRNYKKNKKK